MTLWCLRYVARRLSTTAGQLWAWPILPWSVDSLLTPFLCGEQEADKIGLGAHFWSCSCRAEEMLVNEELDASQEERAVEGVRADMAVFARP